MLLAAILSNIAWISRWKSRKLNTGCHCLQTRFRLIACLVLSSSSLGTSFLTPNSIGTPQQRFKLHKSISPSKINSRRASIIERQSSHLFALTTLPQSLIRADDIWGNCAALVGSASLAQVLGSKTRIGRLLGAPVTAMALTFFAASIGILHPVGSTAAKSLQLLSIQLATPLVLLGADLRNARESCGPLLLSFGFAALGTLVACYVGWRLLGGPVKHATTVTISVL